MKVCNRCKDSKDSDEFHTVVKRGKPSLYHICKACRKVESREYKDYHRDWELQKNYGLTLVEFRSLSDSKNNRCDICATLVSGSLHVDHNHTTGKVRGLLCGPCNRGLGLFKDDQTLIDKASKYLGENN